MPETSARVTAPTAEITAQTNTPTPTERQPNDRAVQQAAKRPLAAIVSVKPTSPVIKLSKSEPATKPPVKPPPEKPAAQPSKAIVVPKPDGQATKETTAQPAKPSAAPEPPAQAPPASAQATTERTPATATSEPTTAPKPTAETATAETAALSAEAAAPKAAATTAPAETTPPPTEAAAAKPAATPAETATAPAAPTSTTAPAKAAAATTAPTASKAAAPQTAARQGAVGKKGPRGAAGAAPEEAAAKPKESTPQQDPRFQRMQARLQHSAARTRRHEPARKKADEAQAAVVPPKTYKEAGAQANKVAAMQAAKSQKPQPTSFLTMLRAEIKRLIPDKVSDVEDFMQGDDRRKLGDAMTSGVQQQKAQATGEVEAATSEPLHTDQVPDQPVTPLPDERAPYVSRSIGAAQAIPAPRPEQEVSLQEGKREAEQQLRDRDLTPDVFQEANDPRFTRVLTAKAEADHYADTAPLKYRQEEQAFLGMAQAAAHTSERKGLGSFLAQRLQTNAKVKTQQHDAKSKDETAQQAVVSHIHDIFTRTKENVDTKLAKLDKDVAAMFDRGADAAIADMRNYVEERFDDRYSGISGKALKLKDWALPLPDKVKAWFPQAHQFFVNEMDTVIVGVANLVDTRLKEVKDRIDQGDKEVHDFVTSLPGKLQSVGQAAEKEISARFADLRRTVEDKKKDLAQGLAQRYKEAREKGDKALQQLKDAHKSLLERFGAWLSEVWDIIANFGRKLVAMLRKAASVIWQIVRHPIRFLEHLIAAAVQGVTNFGRNFIEHLMNVLTKWLFGKLSDRGVTLPKDLSPGSLFKLALEVLGLTRDWLRAKIAQAVGERNLALIEQTWKVVEQLITGGPAALWEQVRNFIGDMSALVLKPILAWIEMTIVKAGIKKLLKLFAPAGAIIEAIQAIYHIITFFINHIRQIGMFLEAIGDSIVQIVNGQIGAAAKYIENTLERALLMVIEFLAEYLGLTGIASRIREVVERVRKPIESAMDRLIGWLAARGRGLIGRVAGIGTGSLTPEQKLSRAMDAAQRAVNRFSGSKIGAAVLRPILAGIRLRYGLRTLEPLPRAGHWAIHGMINPELTVDTEALVSTPAQSETAPNEPATVPAQIAVGKQIQLAGAGGGWRPYPYRITAVTDTHIHYRYEGKSLPRAASLGGMSPLSEFGRHWRLYEPESGDLPFSELLAYNGGPTGTITRWNDRRIARKVLNYRYYNSQLNPPGKEWEHVIEHSAGGPNSVDNLVLADATLNRDLGTWFGQRQPSASGFPNTGALSVREFLDAANANAAERRRWKMRAYAIYRVKLQPRKDEGRGPYRTLE